MELTDVIILLIKSAQDGWTKYHIRSATYSASSTIELLLGKSPEILFYFGTRVPCS
jgi:hypothetical protein